MRWCLSCGISCHSLNGKVVCFLFYNLNPAKLDVGKVAFLDSNFGWFSWHNVIAGYIFKLNTGTCHASNT